MGDEAITRVGIAVVEQAGRYLVGVRDESVPLGGYAEFPGGKCRPGESAAECAIRECAEETGLRVRIVEPLLDRRYEYPHGMVDLHFFSCTPIDVAVESQLQGSFEWVAHRGLGELTFPPANEPVIDRLLDRHLSRKSNHVT